MEPFRQQCHERERGQEEAPRKANTDFLFDSARFAWLEHKVKNERR